MTTPADPPLPVFVRFRRIGGGKSFVWSVSRGSASDWERTGENLNGEVLEDCVVEYVARSALEEECSEHAKTRAEHRRAIEFFDLESGIRQRVEDERDALAAKLEKAMAVVERSLKDYEETDVCWFCHTTERGGHGYMAPCVLVAQGFIDRDGRRLETAGKEGA